MKKTIVSFEARVKNGEFVPLERVAKLTDYSTQHLRRLCHAKTVAHKRHKRRFYFTAAQIEALMPVDVEPAA